MAHLLRLTTALLAALYVGPATAQDSSRALPPSFALRATVQSPKDVADPAPARILFNATDERNTYALILEPSSARLVRVLDGNETLLAGPVPVSRQEATPVLVLRDPGRMTCWVGGTKLSAVDDSLAGGQAGRAVSEGGLALADWRVQPVEPVEFADDFMRGEGDPDPWSRLAGTWELDRIPNPTWSANAFRYIGRGTGSCLAATGEWFWHDVVVRASVVPGKDCGAVGVASCVEDLRNYLVLRWRSAVAPQLEGTLEIARVRDGKTTVLAQAAGNLDRLQPSELALAVRGDLAVAFVDGERVLRARGDFGCGRAGLTCRDAAGARFDDVHVASVVLSEEQLAGEAGREVLPVRRASVAERFRTDQYMQQWASELGNWLADGQGTYWHTGLFRGDFELVWDTDEALLFEQGPITVLTAADDRDAAKGSALTIARAGEAVTAKLTREGKPAGEWTLDLPAARSIASFALKRRGETTELSIAGQPVAKYSDALTVTQVGLQCRWSRKRKLMHYATASVSEQVVAVPAVQNFECTGPLLLDYSFHDAPVDWRVDAGTWEVTSRWICLPYFTWLGGQSHEAAILWHKRRFSGDVTLDLYAAVMMNYGPYSGYDRYGDLNVTFCADGQDLSSGYSAQFGGLANTKTRILRGDKVVAETDAILYPSRNGGAHNHWYHVRLEKRGATVRLFVDNRLAGEYTDPAPLTGRRLAIWTWNRGLMIARARVWAERDGGPSPAFGAGRLPALLTDRAPAAPSLRFAWSWGRGLTIARGPAAPEGDSAPFRVASSSHPSAFFSFDRGAEGWGNRTGEHGGQVRWQPRGAGGCLRVENPTTGGDMAVHPPLEPFDAREFQRLTFDYRLPGDVRVNLYLHTGGRWHVVGLTAPTDPEFHAIRESREISGRVTATSGLQLEEPPPLVLGQIEAVADGSWQHAAFDLLAALRSAHPDQAGFVVDGLHFGNWSNKDYLQCGFGGNRRGAAFWLDNVFLGRHGGGSGKFEWDGERAWVVDVSPTAYPTNAAASEAPVAGLASGTSSLHLGEGEAVRHHRFLVDVDPPRVGSVEPEPGAKAAPTALKIVLADPGGSGVEPRSLRVTVNGAPVAVDVQEDGVVADLRGLRFDPEQTVSCDVTGSDRAGNGMEAPFRWQWTYDRALDKSPPSVPMLTSPAPSGWDEDFEAPSDEWGRSPGSPWVDLSLDESTSSSGRRCLRIEGGPGPFRCFVRRRAFDIKARPTLSFDYLADPQARWSLAFLTDAGWRSYRPRPTRERAAGGWQHVDLRVDHMLAIATKAQAPVVRAIAVFGSDQRAGRTAVVRLDAMRLLPAVFTGREVTLRWSADDPSGIEGYSFGLDGSPDTVPDTTVDATGGEGTFPLASSGTVYFHCRARDGAGNWGDSLHQPLVVQRTTDTDPPALAGVWPEGGARAAADTLRVRVQDAGTGVSAERLRLHVAGKAYGMDSPELRFLPAQGELLWTASQRPAFPDGAEVACRVEAADYAGNALAPASWSWRMDFAQDKTPPDAPFVSWAPAGALVFQDFERDQGQWMGRREGWAERTDEDPATGSHCVRFGGMSTFLQYERYDAEKFPIVGFDYRLAPGSRLDLMCRIENRNLQIQFTGASRYPLIGTVPGIVADGRWHSCRFDLATMLRNAQAPPMALFVDHLATQTRSGEPFHADNFFIAPAGADGVRVQWSVPRDATGIRGYSVALDRKADTAPDPTINSTDPHKDYADLEVGTWYVHVRACDGAGNWGSAGHAKLDMNKP